MRKLNKVPIVTRRENSIDPGSFPLKHYSYSTFVKFSSNPILFKIQYINGDVIETTRSISSIIGQAFHNALEIYYSDGYGEQNIELGLAAGTQFIEELPEGFIEYSERVNTRQKALEIFAFAYGAYIQEKPLGIDITIGLELMLNHQVSIEWNGEQLILPIPLKGFIDRLVRRKNGTLVIRDYKCVAAFSNPDKIDGAKIIQAIQYFLLVYAEYGEAPYSMVFEEVKNTKNRDGGKQVQEYEIVYSKIPEFFRFYFRLYDDVTRGINGEMVYVPNVHTLFDNEVAIVSYIHRLDVTEEAARLMEKLQVSNITDLLKAQIEQAGTMRKLMENVEKKFILATSLNYSDMTTDQKIQTKLMEHGLLVKFDSKIEGHSVELYRFSPSIGLKMNKLKSFISDVEQVIGQSGVRVLAPIPNSTFIGFEVPKKNRESSPLLPNSEIKDFKINMGLDLYGQNYLFDITKAPHMLIAGTTGSGKSVFLNTLITQLAKIENADLCIFDPKMVELSEYRSISEYEYDPILIAKTLEGLVGRMNNRYAQMAEKGIKEWQENRLFVIIDEFGDLTASKIWIEEAGIDMHTGKSITIKTNISEQISKNILILAQKARSAGIHLIIATQRPSVDIITGTIKANFPTKVAFRMAKETDSRILLDAPGAEKLLGRGDMIFSSEQGDVRLQGFII